MGEDKVETQNVKQALIKFVSYDFFSSPYSPLREEKKKKYHRIRGLWLEREIGELKNMFKC